MNMEMLDVGVRRSAIASAMEIGEYGFLFDLGDIATPVMIEYKPDNPECTSVLLADGKGGSWPIEPNERGVYHVHVGFRKTTDGKGWYVVGSDKGNHLTVLEMDEVGKFTRTLICISVQGNKAYLRKDPSLEAWVVDPATVAEGNLAIVPTSSWALYDGRFHTRWTNTTREALELAKRMGIVLPSASEHPFPVWTPPEVMEAKKCSCSNGACKDCKRGKVCGMGEGIVTWWNEAGNYGGIHTSRGAAFLHFSQIRSEIGFVSFTPGETVKFAQLWQQSDGKVAAQGVERL